MRIELPTIENAANVKFSFVEDDNSRLKSIRIGGDDYRTKFYMTEKSMRKRGISIEMYKLRRQSDNRFVEKDVDLADIKVFGSRTPIQIFKSKRTFADIPIQGEAYFVAQAPDGQVYHGKYDSKSSENNIIFLGEGWVFSWIAIPGKVFRFLELCNPRFIDKLTDFPADQEELVEISAEDLSSSDLVTQEFKEVFETIFLIAQTES